MKLHLTETDSAILILALSRLYTDPDALYEVKKLNGHDKQEVIKSARKLAKVVRTAKEINLRLQ